jgi:hypothetical protein
MPKYDEECDDGDAAGIACYARMHETTDILLVQYHRMQTQGTMISVARMGRAIAAGW